MFLCDFCEMVRSWLWYSESIDKSISQVIGSSNSDHARTKARILYFEHSVFLGDQFAVLDKLVIQEIDLVLPCNHAHARVCREDLLGLHVNRERSRLVLVVHSVVEDSVSLGPENQRSRGNLEINYLFIFVKFIVSTGKGAQFEVAHYERVGSGSKDTGLTLAETI